MTLFIGIALIVMAVFLVIAVLMQSSKDHRHGGVVAGGAETFFGKQKGKSLDAMFNKLTTVIAVIFVILVVVLYVIQPSFITLTIDANGNEAIEDVVIEKVDIANGVKVSDLLKKVDVADSDVALIGIAETEDAAADETLHPNQEIYPTVDTTLYLIWEQPEGETPEVVEGETPEVVEGETPEVVEGETPEVVEGETPEVVEGETPEVVEGETPEVVEGETPEVTEG